MENMALEAKLERSQVTIGVDSPDESTKHWDHQIAAWNEMDRHFSPGDRSARAGIVVVPTGGGKTRIACLWLLKNHVSMGGRVLWLTHRHSLLKQSFKVFGYNSGYANGGHARLDELSLIRVSGNDCRFSEVMDSDHCVFSTIQTAITSESFVTHMAEHSPKGLFVVVDEAHHAAASSYRKLLKELKNRHKARLLGLTATPVRMDPDDQARLTEIFDGQFIYQISAQELIHKGILAYPQTVTVTTEIEFERAFDQHDFKHLDQFGELSKRVLDMLAKHARRNNLIVDHYKERNAVYGKTIVFAANIAHAQTLVKEFKAGHLSVDYVDSTRTSDENYAVMKNFLDPNGISVIVNVEMLTEGFDAPLTRTVFIARPTASETLLRQMVGRALRGPAAGGKDVAYLVTFVDTWQQYTPLPTEYVFGEVIPPKEVIDISEPPLPKPVPIPPDLLWEAYSVIKSLVKSSDLSHYECMPFGWFSWEEELDDDMITRHVLIFENQQEAFEDLRREILSDSQKIPEQPTDEYVEWILRDYFGDTSDPLPSIHELKTLLLAFRKGLDVAKYTLREKDEIDPTKLAKSIVDRNVGALNWNKEIDQFYEAHQLCASLYPGESGKVDFREDVFRAALILMKEGNGKHTPPVIRVIEDMLPEVIRASGPGHKLEEIWDAVTSQKAHFPRGVPKVSDRRYSKKPLKGYWGICRCCDGAIVINRILNSLDVPRFVLEFLMYHEVLHADMPYSGHNKEFKDREKRFVPSEIARREAEQKGFKPATVPDAWRVLADQYLDTFHRRFRTELNQPESVRY
jgi:superfamily II DNA or RNA helicase